MELWQLLLYVLASVLALRSLISLMAHHRSVTMHQLLAEQIQRRKDRKGTESEDAESSEPASKSEQQHEYSQSVSRPEPMPSSAATDSRVQRAAG